MEALTSYKSPLFVPHSYKKSFKRLLRTTWWVIAATSRIILPSYMKIPEIRTYFFGCSSGIHEYTLQWGLFDASVELFKRCPKSYYELKNRIHTLFNQPLDVNRQCSETRKTEACVIPGKKEKQWWKASTWSEELTYIFKVNGKKWLPFFLKAQALWIFV